MNDPEIKGTALINKYPDGKKGLDSANIYWLKKGSQPDAKSDFGLGLKSSQESSPPHNR